MNKIERNYPQNLIVDKIGRISGFNQQKENIRNELMKLTQSHCAYCDCVLRLSEYTPHIEHFRPAESFPSLKEIWHNLFASCPKCNSIKGRRFSKKALKPDKNEYSFDYWFEIEWETFKIKPNECRTDEEQLRAEITIDLLGLNDVERPKVRKNELHRYKTLKGDINEFSYRFVLERAEL